MKLYAPQLSYRLRWIILVAWLGCMVVYISWLIEPLGQVNLLLTGKVNTWFLPSRALTLAGWDYWQWDRGLKSIFGFGEECHKLKPQDVVLLGFA